MVTVMEASAIVLANIPAAAIVRVPIEESVGRALAEPVSADRDLPPVDRVTMDGIALAYASWSGGQRAYEVEGVQAAGTPQATLGRADGCFEVMTGAALPAGADTVIPYEEVRLAGRRAELTSTQVLPGQNIHRRGSDAKAGAPLLQPGVVISPAEIALMATVGKDAVMVFEFPSTAILSTGDELIPISESPAPYQVRRSNTYAIQAAMKALGWPSVSFHLPDDRDAITTKLKHILDEYDTVILSGGVSKGKFDFIPDALESNGIVKQFHRVNQRPGKPFWFGTSPDKRKTVFALPGNPVSTYLCFYRYVRPWILKSHQIEDRPQMAVLAHDFAAPAGLTYFLQVSVRNEQGLLMAYPDAGGGSGDLANLKDVTGFLEITDVKGAAKKGQVFRYYPFRF